MERSTAYTQGQFVWWQGVIVDVDDPEQSGRVRARIFGYHDDDDSTIPNDHLPWADVGLPTTSAGISGVGETHGLKRGSWVTGYFLDGHSGQLPVVLHSIAGVPSEKGSGPFSDKTGEYPRFVGESDVNRLARGDAHSEFFKEVQNSRITGIQKSDGTTWDQPKRDMTSKYPYNKVIEWGGHAIELDGTEGNGRINIQHSSGAFIEIDKNGGIIIRTKKDASMLFDGNLNIKSNNVNWNVNGNFDLNVSGKVTIKANLISLMSKIGSFTFSAVGAALNTTGSFNISVRGVFKSLAARIFLN